MPNMQDVFWDGFNDELEKLSALASGSTAKATAREYKRLISGHKVGTLDSSEQVRRATDRHSANLLTGPKDDLLASRERVLGEWDRGIGRLKAEGLNPYTHPRWANEVDAFEAARMVALKSSIRQNIGKMRPVGSKPALWPPAADRPPRPPAGESEPMRAAAMRRRRY